jgi:ML domain
MDLLVSSGTPLSISATGVLKESVEKGAYVILQVKYGVITLIKQTVDLCDQVSNVDLDCPLEEGPLTLSKDVDLPRQIPPVSAPAYRR